MNRRCPHCGKLVDAQPDDLIEQLRQWCRANGHPVFPGDRVSESTAAAILGRAPATLRNWRIQGGPIAAQRTGAGRGRISYRLSDLAEHLESPEGFT